MGGEHLGLGAVGLGAGGATKPYSRREERSWYRLRAASTSETRKTLQNGNRSPRARAGGPLAPLPNATSSCGSPGVPRIRGNMLTRNREEQRQRQRCRAGEGRGGGRHDQRWRCRAVWVTFFVVRKNV